MTLVQPSWRWDTPMGFALLVVHQPVRWVDVDGRDRPTTCRGCGQLYPCDAVQLANAAIEVLRSWHATPIEAMHCGGERCTAMLNVLLKPRDTNVYPEDFPDEQ